jgi:DNA invertase Pin-like site-specific DNA recombinase
MLARATACSVHGLAGVPVLIEADIANGLPNFTIVGLTDRAIQEARERVKASVRNSGFEWPQRRLTVNLAPAEVPKEGTGFDLGIAMAILCLTNRILRLEGLAFIGELALDGSVRPVTGVLPMARCLRVAGIRRLVVAEENAAEAALVESLEVVGVSSLARCVAHLDGSDPLPLAAPGPRAEVEETTDLSEVRGQEQAKRALEIAAAGGHNLLMVGPPSSCNRYNPSICERERRGDASARLTSEGATMTTAIYARISDDRADRAGVDRQLADCRALCKRKKWPVDTRHEYVDNSVSASQSGKVRPQYRAMMTAIEAGEVNRIVVYMVDRLYRMPRELEDLIDLAIAGKVEVYSTQSGEGIDLSSIDGATMARVVVALASGESRKISARVLRQQADRRAKGLHHGATRPLGYERVEGRFVPKPDEAAVIKAAMHSILGGMSLADVAREWTRLHVAHPQPSRKTGEMVYPWSATGVGLILHSPRNIGIITHRGVEIGAGEWVGIVDRDLYDRCMATFRQRRKRGIAPSRRGMLTGLIFCGECGEKMLRGRNARTQYYRCPGSGKAEANACGTVAITAQFVEDLTLAAVRERLSGKDFGLTETPRPQAVAKLHAIERQLRANDRKVESLTREWVDKPGGAFSASVRAFRLATEGLGRIQAKLTEQRDALLAASPTITYTGNVDALLEDWRSDRLTADQRHEIIAAVLGRITVAHVGRGKWPIETMTRRVTFG